MNFTSELFHFPTKRVAPDFGFKRPESRLLGDLRQGPGFKCTLFQHATFSRTHNFSCPRDEHVYFFTSSPLIEVDEGEQVRAITA
jgi:hypothetical protein